MNFILGIFDKVNLVGREKVLVVHKKHLQIFSKALALYPTVFVLDPGGESRTFGNLVYIKCKPVELKEHVLRIPRSEILEYDALAEMIVSYMDPRTTSLVGITASTRDESLPIAHGLLKLMKNYKIASHVLFFLDFDYATLDSIDKVNLALIVSELLSQGKYTILPLSFERVVKNSLKMEVADYVEKCVAELTAELHKKPLIGTFIPLCFRLEPISIFRDMVHSLNMLFFIYTGRVKTFVEGFTSGSIDVWSGFKDEVSKIERSLGKVKINFIDSDRLDVKTLVEFSLRDVVAEGADIIAKIAPLDEIIEILANLRHLSLIKV